MKPDHGTMSKALILVLLIGIFYLCTLRAGQGWDDDFAMYIHHAKNIATGVSYGSTGYIYDAQAAAYGPKTYPPVLPLLLAGVYKLFGLNLTAMKIEIVLLFLASLLAMAAAFRSDLRGDALLVLLAGVGFSPFLWNIKENIVATLPFLLFLYLALWLIHRAEDEGQAFSYPVAAISGAMIYLAYGTRTVGVCLIGALWLRDLLRHRKLSRYSVVATTVFAIGCALQMHFVRGEGSYFDQFRGMPALLSHVLVYAKSASLFWDTGYGRLFRIPLLVAISGLAVTGYLWRLSKRVTILETFLLTYLLLLLIWPSPSELYIVPVLPLYFFYALTGLDVAAKPLSAIWSRRALLGLLAVLVAATYLAKYSRMNFGPLSGVEDADAQSLFAFVSSGTKADDVLVFRKPRALSLFADRSAATYHATSNDGELWDYFCKIHANYIVASKLDSQQPVKGASATYFSDFIARNSASLQAVYANPDFRVYRIRDGSCEAVAK